MDQKTVTVINWMALALVVPAAIGLAWKTVNDTLKGNGLSSDVITASLFLGFVGIGVTQLNIGDEVSWLRWVLLVAELLLLVVLYKRLWPPFIQTLRK
jgi:hypothetical protein